MTITFWSAPPTVSAHGWTIVTNAVVTSGDRLFVIVDTDASPRFYRLRKS